MRVQHFTYPPSQVPSLPSLDCAFQCTELDWPPSQSKGTSRPCNELFESVIHPNSCIPQWVIPDVISQWPEANRQTLYIVSPWSSCLKALELGCDSFRDRKHSGDLQTRQFIVVTPWGPIHLCLITLRYFVLAIFWSTVSELTAALQSIGWAWGSVVWILVHSAWKFPTCIHSCGWQLFPESEYSSIWGEHGHTGGPVEQTLDSSILCRVVNLDSGGSYFSAFLGCANHTSPGGTNVLHMLEFWYRFLMWLKGC